MSLIENIEFERLYLGLLIRDGDYNYIEDLMPEDFQEPIFGDIYNSILDLKSRNEQIDELTVANNLNKINFDYDFKQINLTINGLVSDAQSHIRFNKDWVKQIKRTSDLRKILKHAEELKRLSLENYDPDKIIAFSESQLKNNFSRNKNKSSKEMSHDELINFDRKNDPNSVIGNFRWLNKGSSMLIVSQSGVGKSSFALQFMISLTVNLDKGFFGIKAHKPLKVVMLQAENDLGDVAEAYQDIVSGMFLDYKQKELLKENLKIFRDSSSIGDKFVSKIRDLIIENNADVILVDPLLSFAGIEVSDQKQMTEFLRQGIARVLEETGAILIAVHHTTKPRSAKETQDLTSSDLAYSGAGSSELVNYVREVGVLQRCKGDEPIFKFSLTKRRNRSGMRDVNGEFKPEIYIRHNRNNNCINWGYSNPPEEINEKTNDKKQDSNKLKI